MSGERTEKATAKRRGEAKGRGQVARSQEVNSTFVLAATVVALMVTASAMWTRMVVNITETLALTSRPEITVGTIQGLCQGWLTTIALLLAPIVVAAVVAGVTANVLQNKPSLSSKGLKPDFKRVNPLPGLKRMVGTHAWVELAKSLLKVAAVGGIAYLVLSPQVDQLLHLDQASPSQVLSFTGGLVKKLSLFIVATMVPIALADVIYQRYTHEKSLKMSKQDVKEESRQQDIAPEIKSAIRRRAFQVSRQRMLAQVPTADVIVTNPTHYAVALRYGKDVSAPRVVAKGQDLIAQRIREIADEHGISIVENPPLARALYAQVEVGQDIPPDFFAAVAEVLAYVYRTSRRALSWK